MNHMALSRCPVPLHCPGSPQTMPPQSSPALVESLLIHLQHGVGVGVQTPASTTQPNPGKAPRSTEPTEAHRPFLSLRPKVGAQGRHLLSFLSSSEFDLTTLFSGVRVSAYKWASICQPAFLTAQEDDELGQDTVSHKFFN